MTNNENQEFEEIEIKGTSCSGCRFQGVSGVFNLYGRWLSQDYDHKTDRPEYCKDQTIKLRIK